MSVKFFFYCAALILCSPSIGLTADIQILFLGDHGHHHPADRFAQLQPVLEQRGIHLTYTDKISDLNPETLSHYDGVILYANIGQRYPEQEQALFDYVSKGHGFIPIHCASFCFLNSEQYVELVGAQFQRHGTGVFRSTITQSDHPIMRGFDGFTSWDETYVHHNHNETDRVVLSYRVDREGREPWTWIRTSGQGRVFYTAWGHDERTWGNPGFQNLIERGIRWAVNADPGVVPSFADPTAFPVPDMSTPKNNVEPFEYVDAKVPFYPPSDKWGTLGKPKTEMQRPLTPQASQQHLVVPVDFHPALYASDPDIFKPICMNWDERGRLWVCETMDYPNQLQPAGKGRDRITICEDTDHDGRADRFTVFADKLSIPTSLTFAHGGVLVHQAPHTLFLRDDDGDDQADTRKILFSGWSTRDTHAGPSNLQQGLDNWIYGIVGYAGFKGTIAGVEQNFRTGFYRFQLSPGADGPDVSAFEFLRNTNNNSWGVGISEEGLLFGSTANRNPSVFMPIANRYYERVRGWSSSVLGSIADTHTFKPITDKIRQVDHHGGYTAGAGHALYTARRYPAAYWNRTAFVCGPTGHLVGTFVLSPQGADYHATSPFNLLASDDEWTAPIMAEVGPDGNVWVIDWYNYIVQHNPTPSGFKTGKGNAYETNLRDKRHGRVYRLVHGSDDQKAIDLGNATPQQLVAALSSDNLFWRRHAQRLLLERGMPDIVPDVIKLASSTTMDAVGLNPSVIHALWLLHGLGAFESHPSALSCLHATLKHPSAGVRRNAVRMLPATDDSITAIVESDLLRDTNGQVRLAAFLALSDMPPNTVAGQAIAKSLSRSQNADDRWIRDAATAAAATHVLFFLTAAANDDITPGVLENTVSVVTQHMARSGYTDMLDPVLLSLADASPEFADAVLAGLLSGWPEDKKVGIPDETIDGLITLMARLSPSSQGMLVQLTKRWGSTRFDQYAAEIVARLLEDLSSEDASDMPRLAAARQLIALRVNDPDIISAILDSMTPQIAPDVAKSLIDTIGNSTAPDAGSLLIDRLDQMTPATRTVAIAMLLSRPKLTHALLDGVEQRKLQLADLSLDQKQLLSTHPERTIRARARTLLKTTGGGLPDPDRQKVLDRLTPVTQKMGDAVAGKQVYAKQCAKCHMHSGEGKMIGPDLTGMAVHPKIELLTHIIDPNRNVEGNYRIYTVVTAQGIVLSGLLASETKTAIEIIDAEAKKHIVLREDIADLVASPKSLMPEGFEKQISSTELTNLLAFLTQRGKYLPIPLDKAATVVSTKGMFFEDASSVERLIFPDWKPKTFEGVPFVLIDPQGDQKANVIMLHGPHGSKPPTMPKDISLPCNAPAKTIHMLSGISGWGAQSAGRKGVSMIVRLEYANGDMEDHPLYNGEHFADYIRVIDVPKSKLAFKLRQQQIRYLTVHPKRPHDTIKTIRLVKGTDHTAPVVVAITAEGP